MINSRSGLPQVAVVQINTVANIEENQQVIAQLIAKAASQGASLILLPEMCLSMDTSRYLQIAKDDSLVDWFAEQARLHQVWLLVGAVPQLEPHPRVESDSLLQGSQRVRSALLVFNDLCEPV